MVKRSKLSASEADLLAMKLRRENMVASHKAMMEEYKTRKMIKDAERIKNLQNQYGSLQEAFSRMPPGLQNEAFRRMNDIGNVLTSLNRQYPYNFPKGAGPNAIDDATRRRGVV